MSKKKKNKLSLMDIYKKIRKGWGDISPVTKIKPSQKKKSRAKAKRDFKRELNNEI